jgi:hypothetical protein
VANARIEEKLDGHIELSVERQKIVKDHEHRIRRNEKWRVGMTAIGSLIAAVLFGTGADW